MNHALLTSSLWLAAVSICAAVFCAEHLWIVVHLGRGKEKIARVHALLALVVPLAGPVLAWRSGVRARLLVYFATAAAYLVLRWLA